jgi:hypothetical protein
VHGGEGALHSDDVALRLEEPEIVAAECVCAGVGRVVVDEQRRSRGATYGAEMFEHLGPMRALVVRQDHERRGSASGHRVRGEFDGLGGGECPGAGDHRYPARDGPAHFADESPPLFSGEGDEFATCPGQDQTVGPVGEETCRMRNTRVDVEGTVLAEHGQGGGEDPGELCDGRRRYRTDHVL